MSALTTEINTPELPSGIYRAPLAASTKIFAGAIVALNNSGYAVPAADSANFRVIGRAEETVDNSGGSAADLYISVKRGVFAWANDATNACTIAHVGKKVYVKDDNSIQSVTGTNSVVAGLMIGFENGEVVVDTTLAPGL
jgi:hypothetical protein